MKIKLLRNLDAKRNSEQEDEFEKTMNPSLFFDANRTMNKIDSWKYSNVKKLLENTSFFKKEIVLEYSNWNKNIELISSSLIMVEGEDSGDLTNEEKEIFLDKNAIELQDWVTANVDNKNKQFKALLFIAEITNNNYKIIDVINKVVNEGVSTLSFAIDFSIPLLLIG